MLIGTLVALLFVRRDPQKPSAPEPEVRKALADVGTNVVSRSVVTNDAPVRWPEKNPNRKDGSWHHGEGPRSIAVTNGCVVTYPNYPGVEMILQHPKYAAPFRNISDNEIARLLTAKPGDTFIDVPLPHDFDQRFANSLLEPIKISNDDTPERRELKQKLIEARKMLVEAVKNGESPRAILAEEAKNMRRLMGIRDNYQRILREQIKSGASDQEINDTVNAANTLLKKEGITSKVRLPYKDKLRIDRLKKDGKVKD